MLDWKSDALQRGEGVVGYWAWHNGDEFRVWKGGHTNTWSAGYVLRPNIVFNYLDSSLKIISRGGFVFVFGSAHEAKEVCERFAQLIVLL